MSDTDTLSADALGETLVSNSRKKRLGETSVDEWRNRIVAFIASQPEVDGQVDIDNLRPISTAAGGSNGTLLFDASYSENGQQICQSLVLRFMPAQGLFHEYRADTQFKLQKALELTDVPVPHQLWLDESGEYLGIGGYIMQQVSGTGPAMAWKQEGVIADAEPDARCEMMESYVQNLIKIHQVDWQALGLDWLRQRAEGEKLIDREVNWYWDALVWADNPECQNALLPIKKWLVSNEPDDLTPVLCHGDCNLGNYLFEDNKVSTVVDWEMAFLGTPECDLFYFQAGDINFPGETPRGALSVEQFYQEYESITGTKLRHKEYFYMFALYRISIICVLALNSFSSEQQEIMKDQVLKTYYVCLEQARAYGIECVQ